MIKAKVPRSKPGKGGGDGDGGKPTSASTSGGGGGAVASTGGSATTKKRRPSQKKKEEDDGKKHRGGITGGALLSINLLHQEEQHRRYYQRAPRLLPDIDGVQSLTSSEIQADIKQLTSSLNIFETKLLALLPPGAANPLLPAASGGGYVHHGNHKQSTSLSMEDAYAFMFPKQSQRRARANGVLTPEELVESLPVCRRAVRITQRELAAMKRERDDLERDFMRQRCKLLWQLGEMKRIQKQQDKVLTVLGKDVVQRAKALESSRRRTNALQDIMTELDARGSTVLRLMREKKQLEAQLTKHGVPIPEPEEVYIGDRVQVPFGTGVVLDMDDVHRVITIALAWGGTAYVQEEHVEVLPSTVAYDEREKELKSALFEKVGKLVLHHNGKVNMRAFGGGFSGGRRRSRGGAADSDDDMEGSVLDEEDEEDEDDDDDDDDEEDENDEGDADADGSDRDVLDEKRRPSKKRKIMVLPPSSKKKARHAKVLDFTAGKLPITPYDAGLLISPLSVLPERVAAAAPQDLQWMSAFLPSKMVEWEQERYASLQMQGEIERLRFQLQQAQAEKENAQALAVEQVDSINDLVRQMDKLREQTASKGAKDKDAKDKDKDTSSSSSTGGDACPTCNSSASSSSGSSSTKKPAAKTTKANGKSTTTAKTSTRRQRGDSMGAAADDEDDGVDDKPPQDTEPHDDGEDEFAEDGGESSDTAKRASRSLRPRRASSAASDSGPKTAKQ